jgi:hypothetical protein
MPIPYPIILYNTNKNLLQAISRPKYVHPELPNFNQDCSLAAYGLNIVRNFTSVLSNATAVYANNLIVVVLCKFLECSQPVLASIALETISYLSRDLDLRPNNGKSAAVKEKVVFTVMKCHANELDTVNYTHTHIYIYPHYHSFIVSPRS